MICATCGGLVVWRGPLTNLTHTECLRCGRINNQMPEDEPEPEDQDEPGDMGTVNTLQTMMQTHFGL